VLAGAGRAIRLFLERDHSFGPEDIAKMSAAFEAALGKLGLVDRSDPATHAVAKLIIEFAKQGQRDAVRFGIAAPSKVSRSEELMKAPLRKVRAGAPAQLRNPDNGHTFTGWRGAGGGERRHRPMRQPAVTTDRIDYWIRRDVAPRLHQSNVNPARDRRAALMVIGRLLRDQYNALATPVPPHLAALVEKLKNPDMCETSGYSESLSAQR
jgi:hypothetical protein